MRANLSSNDLNSEPAACDKRSDIDSAHAFLATEPSTGRPPVCCMELVRPM